MSITFLRRKVLLWLADSVDLAVAAQINNSAANMAMRLQTMQLGDGFALGRGSVLAFNAASAALAPFVPEALQPASDLHAEITVNRLQWPASAGRPPWHCTTRRCVSPARRSAGI